MNCNMARRMISLYIDGELKKDREEGLFAHLHSCLKCQEEMKFMSETLKELPAREIIEVSPYFFMRVKTRIAEDRRTNPAIFPLNLKPAFLSAGLFSIMIILSGLAGVFLGETYIAQVKKSEVALDKETKSLLNLDMFEDVPEGSFGYIQNEILGGA